MKNLSQNKSKCLSKGFPCLAVLAVLGSLTSCITPQEKREMHADIFNMQTRLLAMEQNGQETSKTLKNTGEQASQRLANANVELEKVQRDLAKLKGDIDGLKVGVITGHLPGAEPPGEGSLVAQLQTMTTRMDAIEQIQKDLVDQIEKLATAQTSKKDEKGKKGKGADKAKGGKDAKEPKEAVVIKNAKDLRAAYGKGSYKAVTESATEVIKGAEAKDKEDLTFYYAESLFKIGQMRDAALKYNEVLDQKPNSGKHAPQAKLRLGDCFKSLGDAATAKLYYEEVTQKFPGSPEANKAKDKLAGLNKSAAKK